VLSIAALTLLAARLLLAAVFLLAGATKLVDPVGSRKGLRDFGLPSALARPMVVLLPVLELAVAAALVPTSLAWYGAWGALALLTVFLTVISIALVRGRKPNCHCFGQLHSAPVGWPTVIRNGALAACAGWLASRGQWQSGPDLWAWLATLDSHGRKVALVFGCVASFLFLRQLDRSRPEGESIESQLPPAVDDEEAPEAAPASRKRPAPAPTEYSAPARTTPMGIGLPIGTPAPEFELPGITGEKRSLQSLREQGDVLLVFSSPFCESCAALVSNLVRWMHEMEGLPNIVLVNVGTAQDNLTKLKEFDTSRVLLQPNFEVAEMYDCGTTPTAVLVGANGLIRSLLAVGGTAIKQLLSSCVKRGNSERENTKHPMGNVSAPL
jgi:peroxiredoxin